jgi:hypothetical protein
MDFLTRPLEPQMLYKAIILLFLIIVVVFGIPKLFRAIVFWYRKSR